MTAAAAVDLIANLGGVGVVFWLVYYVFTKLLPKQTETFVTALSTQADSFKEALAAQSAEQTRENDRVVAALGKVDASLQKLAGQVERNSRLLMLHDATMRRETGDLVKPSRATTADLAIAAGVDQVAVAAAVLAATKRSTARTLSVGESQELAAGIVEHLLAAREDEAA